jgi:hypothetical protein
MSAFNTFLLLVNEQTIRCVRMPTAGRSILKYIAQNWQKYFDLGHGAVAVGRSIQMENFILTWTLGSQLRLCNLHYTG